MSKLSQPCSTSMILHGDYFNAISINSVVLGERIDAEFVPINESILINNKFLLTQDVIFQFAPLLWNEPLT